MIADSTTNLIRCKIHFIDEFRLSSHDCDHVLEVVATKKVAPRRVRGTPRASTRETVVLLESESLVFL